MSEIKLQQLALSLTKGIGNTNLKNLISYCGSPQEVFSTTKGKLEKVPGIGEKASKSLLDNKEVFEKAEDILEYATKNDIKLLFYTDSDYPTNLKQLYDAPALVYLKGNNFPDNQRIISIVGSRNATKEGKKNVESIINELAPYNPVIISGLAYGIDIEAHKAALKNNLTTYGIMATGIEKVYPTIHNKIANSMLEKGGLLTEYPPFTKMDPARFPARNRIIAGLSDATLVVEAGEKGGALITAYLARDYDRDVFAIPGNLKNEYSVGCNNIIKNSLAQLVSSGEDIAFYLGWENKKNTSKSQVQNIKQDDVNDDEWNVIQLLGNNELHIDEISWKSQIQIGKLASILLNLEFRNIVVSLPGKKYSVKNG